MEDRSLQQVLQHYLENKATPEDIRWLLAHFDTGSEDELMQLLMRDFDLGKNGAEEINPDQAVLNRVYDRLHEDLGFESETGGHRRIRRIRAFSAVAAVVAGLAIGAFFILHQPKPVQQTAQNQQHDIAPGGNKAILTLSNGQKIVLDGKKGQIASQGGRQILVRATGEVVYSGQNTTTVPIYNTLTVPIGNRRDLVLPDGSKVSLDAGSSITYPVVFGSERKVSMTGQAYIIVKHDPAHPFYTTVEGITVKDIGTEFNINAYDDEPAVKTTLITGSVKVNDITLKPGEQAQTKQNSTAVKTADIDAVIAWKNNDFYFDNQSLKSSMRQIARWYNISVVYNNVDEKLKIFVDVSRSTNLSVVLKALENTGKVKCSFDGHMLTLSQPN